MAESERPISRETRVVILDSECGAIIEVIELPAPADVGTEFQLKGDRWCITGCRPRTRVLLARQVQASRTSNPTRH